MKAGLSIALICLLALSSPNGVEYHHYAMGVAEPEEMEGCRNQIDQVKGKIGSASE